MPELVEGRADLPGDHALSAIEPVGADPDPHVVARASIESTANRPGGSIALRSGEYRKKITAVFADLVGSTTIAERLDPEVFRELVVTFLERMAAVVVAHGGEIEHLAGDGVMGVFGAQHAHDDDATRAVSSAMAMFDELDAPQRGARDEGRRAPADADRRQHRDRGRRGHGRRPPDQRRRPDEHRRAAPGPGASGRDPDRRGDPGPGRPPGADRARRRARAPRPARADPRAPADRDRGTAERRGPGRAAAGRPRPGVRAAHGRLRACRGARIARVRLGARRRGGGQVTAGHRACGAVSGQRHGAARALPLLRRGDHLLGPRGDDPARGRDRRGRLPGRAPREARPGGRGRGRCRAARVASERADRSRPRPRALRAVGASGSASARGRRRARSGDRRLRRPALGRAGAPRPAGRRGEQRARAGALRLHGPVRAARAASGLGARVPDHDRPAAALRP